MNLKDKASKSTAGETETGSQTTENANGHGNGSKSGIDFDKLVEKAHGPDKKFPGISEIISDKESEKEPTGAAYKPYAVFPKGMVKQIAAFPFAGIDNVFRSFYPHMPNFYLTESESEELAEPLDVVLWEYSPVLLSQYGSLVTLGFAMIMMIIRKSGWGSAPEKNPGGRDPGDALKGDNKADAAGFE